MEEPGIRQEAGGFKIGGVQDEGENRTQNIPNVPEGVPGTAGGGEGTGASGNLRSGNKDYAELRHDHCKSTTQLKAMTRQFKAQGFKVMANGKKD